ncbi:MAG: proprotein convertase P-domain-containing protein [Hymenobacteraceae bacterium]|nr:proprotein convertase P-domain-containing protein [Hymenobacteraceae bacterium]MDX5397677.1 proprotein convertase P-domain-containing protein [Hymenobacteraceae bacterium]MDX5513753.1 proprotein convertase P-domain-containing protein [Hymenobacteraceae bacterium]
MKLLYPNPINTTALHTIAKILVILLKISVLAFVPLAAGAQTTLFSSGFENSQSTFTYDLALGDALGRQQTIQAFSGSYACVAEGTNGFPRGVNGAVITSSTLNFQPGYAYRVSVRAKVTGGAATIGFAKSTTATNTALAGATGPDRIMAATALTGSYVQYTATFMVSGSESKYVGLQLYGEDNNLEIYLDEVEITETACAAIPVPVSSFVSGCGLGTVTVSAVPAAGTNSIRWYDAASGGNLLGIGTTLNTTAYSYSPLTLYAASYNSTSGCESTNRLAVLVAPGAHVVVNPTASAATVCPGSPVNLQANAYKESAFFNNTAVAIPDQDNTGIYSAVTVAGASPATITAGLVAAVRVNVTHERSSDLIISLYTPDNQVITLSNRNTSGQNLTNTVFRDDAGASLASGAAPYTGFFTPATTLSTVSSGNMNGTWRLRVVDPVNNRTGTLNNWELVLLENTNLSYNWSSAPAGFSSTVAAPAATPAANTTYTVTVTDNSSGCEAVSSVSVATFTDVTWLGTSTNWNDAANWSPCIPIASSNVSIPGGLAFYPVLNGASVAVNNLELQSAAQLTILTGNLEINGNLADNGNIVQTGGTVELTSNSDFNINSTSFYNLRITGSGTKTLSGPVSIANQLEITNGTLNTNGHTITLTGSAILSETGSGYVLGNIAASRTVSAAALYDFGGIGLTIEPAAGHTTLPGYTTVTRITGVTQQGIGDSYSISRSYDINAVVDDGLDVTLTFRYSNSELSGLEAWNLTMFRSEDNGATWQMAGHTSLNTSSNTIQLTNVSGFSLWTLGDRFNPLPVELVYFTAQQHQENVVLKWATASELNNVGFAIEFSENGSELQR